MHQSGIKYLHTDGMDFFIITVWCNLRLRSFETAFKDGAVFPWWGLFWAQRKQRLSIGGDISRKSRIALYLRISCCVSAWTAESSSKRRHRQINHLYYLLRLLWFELYPASEEILHLEVEARISLWRGRCVHNPVFACRKERGGDGEEEDQGANLFVCWCHHSTGGQRVCPGTALGLAHFLCFK